MTTLKIKESDTEILKRIKEAILLNVRMRDHDRTKLTKVLLQKYTRSQIDQAISELKSENKIMEE